MKQTRADRLLWHRACATVTMMDGRTNSLNGTITALREYLCDEQAVAFVYLFGSYARGRQTRDSDLDVAVYFYPATPRLEWEEAYHHEREDAVWAAVEKITGIETDLVVLNRAACGVAFSAVRDGVPIVVKDRALLSRFYLTVSLAAEDFRRFVRSYWEIKQRSRSLSETDQSQLIKIVDFLESELADSSQFENLTRDLFLSDSAYRRNIERWVENLVNASIDAAKILLASNQQRIPDTYRETLANLSLLESFPEESAERLAGFAKLRNILAHEYLNIRYQQIHEFRQEVVELYSSLARYVRSLLSNNEESGSPLSR